MKGLGRKSGFTLIELLVVIAMVASFAAIPFPVFAQAKQAALKTNRYTKFLSHTFKAPKTGDTINDVIFTNPPGGVGGVPGPQNPTGNYGGWTAPRDKQDANGNCVPE